MRTIFQCVIAAGAIVAAKLYNLVVVTDLINSTFIIVGLLYALAMYFTTIPFVVSDLTTQNKIQGIMEKPRMTSPISLYLSLSSLSSRYGITCLPWAW